MAADEAKAKEKEAEKQAREAFKKEIEAKFASGEYSLPQIPVIEPHINASIWPTEDGKWVMGNLMLCERVPEVTKAPSDAIVTWQDSKGEAYCLRPRKDKNPAPPYDPANGPIIPRHFTSAIFEIGTDVLIKVRYAPEGWPRCEGDALRLVREKAPEVLVPEAIHYWHDNEWSRYYLILRRVHGKTLDKAWFTLSEKDKLSVSKEVAAFIRRTAAITSPLYQGPDSEPVPFFRLVHAEGVTGMYDPVYGGWPGPFTPSEFRAYLKEVTDGLEPPEFDDQFHLYQGDPSPENIIVTGAETSMAAEPGAESKVRVAAIIDWERAGFYPDFWSLMHPNVPFSGFELSLTMEQIEEDEGLASEYRDRLLNYLLYGDDYNNSDRFSALMAWWKGFEPGRTRYFKKRAQARLKAEAEAAQETQSE